MSRLIFSTWLISAMLHSLVIVPFVVTASSGTNVIYDDGTGDDAFKIQGGLAVDMVSAGDAAEKYQLIAAAPPVLETKLIEPNDDQVITAAESPIETAMVTEEPPPLELPKPVEIEQIETEKSAGVAKSGGKTTEETAYRGKLYGALQKVMKLDRDIKGSGQVAMGFWVDQNGHVISREVIKSSGIAALDKAAAKMFDKASFPPLPDGLGTSKYFTIPLDF